MKRSFLSTRRVPVLRVLSVVVLLSCNITPGTFSWVPETLARTDDSHNRRRCTLRSAKGTYGFGLVGTVVGIGPISTSGTTTFDGEGGDSGQFRVTTSSDVQEFSFTGTYTVNRDCTGTATLNISPSVFGFSVLHFEAVGVDDNREIKWLITDPGVILAGSLSRQ